MKTGKKAKKLEGKNVRSLIEYWGMNKIVAGRHKVSDVLVRQGKAIDYKNKKYEWL